MRGKADTWLWCAVATAADVTPAVLGQPRSESTRSPLLLTWIVRADGPVASVVLLIPPWVLHWARLTSVKMLLVRLSMKNYP